jgi:hypothetical protein
MVRPNEEHALNATPIAAPIVAAGPVKFGNGLLRTLMAFYALAKSPAT